MASNTEVKFIHKVGSLVRKHLEDSHCGHDVPHAFRVMRLAEDLIAHHPESVDRESILISALVHDICRPMEMETGKSHFGVEALAFIGATLRELGIGEPLLERVLAIVRFHDVYDANQIDNLSQELMIHQDADRLDALGAIGIARTFAFGGARGRPMYVDGESLNFEGTFVEHPTHGSSSIAHFYEKLFKLKDQMHTARGRELAGQRHEVMKRFVDAFFEEWRFGIGVY